MSVSGLLAPVSPSSHNLDLSIRFESISDYNSNILTTGRLNITGLEPTSSSCVHCSFCVAFLKEKNPITSILISLLILSYFLSLRDMEDIGMIMVDDGTRNVFVKSPIAKCSQNVRYSCQNYGFGGYCIEYGWW